MEACNHYLQMDGDLVPIYVSGDAEWWWIDHDLVPIYVIGDAWGSGGS